MYSLPIALILARGAAQGARNALPGAPVVPHVDRLPLALRTRKAVAGGLRHLADVVAPRPVRHPRCSQARAGRQADAAATVVGPNLGGLGQRHMFAGRVSSSLVETAWSP